MALHRIGNYELLGELGRGGMGVVYRGVDSFIKRPVAIKTIYLSEIQDDQERQFLRERLYREAQSAGILSHPNIVTIYQIGEQDEVTYIAMEFVDGPNLADVLRKRDQGKLSLDSLVSIFEQTASGLDHAHSQGVIHRDIKPANIIVRNDGVAKITDFGVAKISSQTVTRTGMTLGTPHFMAPEQIQGKTLDGRADQYSLGVLMYEAITGRRPFTADSMTTLIFKIVTDPVDPKRDNPHLTDAVSEVLKRALAKKAEDRYSNCEALARAFREAVGMGMAPSVPAGNFSPRVPSVVSGTQPYPGATSFPSGSAFFPPPGSGSAGASTGSNSASSPAYGGGPSVATPTPTPTSTGAATPVQRPPIPPSAPSAPPVPVSMPQPHWQPATPSAGTGTFGTNFPSGGATPVAGRSWWVPAVLVVVGLALVGGVFVLFNLFTGGKQVPAAETSGSTQMAALPSDLAGESARPSENSDTGSGTTSPLTQDVRQSSTPKLPANAVVPASQKTSAGPGTRTTTTSTPVPTQISRQPVTARGSADAGSSTITNSPTSSVARTAAKPPLVSATNPTDPDMRPPEAKAAIPIPNETVTRNPETATSAPPAMPATPQQTKATPIVTSAPRPTLRVPAVYPAAARREGISGTVSLRTLVNANGVPTSIEVVKGIRPDLDAAAKAALSKWRFQPGTMNGQPVDARVNVEITFSLVQDSRKPISLRNP